MNEDIEQQSEIDEIDKQPAGRRWDPLGAANEESDLATVQYDVESRTISEVSRIKSLEEEQEMLSTSLLSLTTHFAQVQFRLRQIVDAAPEDRDKLLANLEEFAFRGIPEVTKLDIGEHEYLFKAMDRQRNRQFELIAHLKQQLSDVEKFAYESGAKVLPQSMLVEKQKVIIDELKNKVNLNVCDDDLPQLSSEDLRNQVDCALGEFVGPVKMKDTLVGQLKTQIVDLERFVAYLQCETYDLKQMTKAMAGYKNCEIVYSTYNSKMAKNRRQTMLHGVAAAAKQAQQGAGSSARQINRSKSTPTNSFPISSSTETLSAKASTILHKATSIMNMFAVTQLGCGSGRFQKNILKRTAKGNHWGDLRAQLEVDIQEIISLVSSIPSSTRKHGQLQPSASSSDSDNAASNGIPMIVGNSVDTYASIQTDITRMVRKQFAVTLEKLMEHGLREDVLHTTSLVPFIACFSNGGLSSSSSSSSSAASRRHKQKQYHYNAGSDDDDCVEGATGSSSNTDGYSDGDCNDSGSDDERQMHVWELILEYYHIKNGDKFNETPARKLSQSFNLDIAGTASSSNKQSLLSAIGSIISIHAPYKRSYNSHFKALISMALNKKKLTQWLHLIFQCRELIEQYYADWSYISRTGFRDGLKSIDRLSHYQFDLAVDLAVRQFQNIKDVFM